MLPAAPLSPQPGLRNRPGRNGSAAPRRCAVQVQCRSFHAAALCLFTILTAGCSDVIGDAMEELNYDKGSSTTTTTQPPASGTISGAPLPAASPVVNGGSVTIARYDLNSRTITAGQPLNVHWTVESSPTSIYTAEFYLSDTLAPEIIATATPVFSRNGGTPSFGSDVTVRCTWQVSTDSVTLLCPESPAYQLPLQPVTYAVLRACTFSARMDTVCTQSAVLLSPALSSAGLLPAAGPPMATYGNSTSTAPATSFQP